MTAIIKVDPVCGMVVEPETATATYTYAGWTYLFCCQECCDRFRQAPEACVVYLAHSRSPHLGHLCRQQRKDWQAQVQEDFR